MQQQLRSYAIFCDDIRQEANGKTMFIGTYRDYMVFGGNPPWLLPTFAVHVVYREPYSPMPPEVRFEIRLATSSQTRIVYEVGNPSFENHIPGPGASPDWDLQPFRQARFTVNLSQLIIEGEARLSVHALLGVTDTLVDRLRIIRSAPLPPSPPPAGGIADLFGSPTLPTLQRQ